MQWTLPKQSREARDHALERVVSELFKLRCDTAWAIAAEEKKPLRSDHQNRYLWGVCYREVCKHLEGFDAEDVHELMLGEWAGWEVVEAFGKKRQRPIRRSSKLNKQEFADFVDFIQRYMAEKGIFIPDPEL